MHEWIDRLELKPHPEGGFFRRIYTAEDDSLSIIHYALPPGAVSRWHVVQKVEAWHLLEGDGLQLLDYDPSARSLREVQLLPADRMHVVPAGHWQAARPIGTGALVTCSVAPAFDYRDFAFVADLEGHEPHFEEALAAYHGLL